MRQLLDYLIAPGELEDIIDYNNEVSISNQKYWGDQKKNTNNCEVPGRDNELKASIRLSSRVFLAGSVVLTLVDRLQARLHGSNKFRPWNGLGVRVPLSLSILLLLHRIIHGVAVRLQLKWLLTRENNLSHPMRTLRKVILSPIMPSGAAAISGMALASIPSKDARLTIAIYVFTKTMEYLSNALRISERTPWWFGSWTLFPLALGQLFRSLLNGEGDIPFIYRKALMAFPTSNIDQHHSHLIGPRMADVARLQFPTFNSTILFPRNDLGGKGIESVLREAHPAIHHLSCAISHPKSVSCLGAWATFCLYQIRRNTQIFSVFYVILFLSKLRSFRGSGPTAVSELVKKTIRTSTFVTSTVATSWSALCLCQRLFPRKMLGPQAFFVSGFLGGLMAFFDRAQSHPLFLDAARGAMLSWWKTKGGFRYFRGLVSPDILLFILSIATLNVLYDLQPTAITSKGARAVIRLLRGSAGRNNRASKNRPTLQPGSMAVPDDISSRLK